MLKDGQKGVILQRDKETYGIAPHIPCGLVTPEILETFAKVARKYNTAAMKITSAARIAILGIKEEDVDAIWEDLKFDMGHAVGLCVRSVKVCPGTQFCRLAKQDSIAMGTKIDETYHGMPLPSKMKMAVSGCKIQCAENCIKDISMFGTDKGWTVLVGGMGGIKPRLAEVLAEDLSTEEAEALVARTIEYYKENSKRTRIGFMIDAIGLQTLKDAVVK
ncbi:MAG: NAD(P)/FAD-dependent oxidoreductase [Desulfocapsaceae bacterium]|nr:NAD(P)/FAD-dependent oxidoreductase [Desulfocapsaceae bacterium]